MKPPVCVIMGAGPGNGAHIGARFAAAGYQVALCARDVNKLEEIARGIDGACAFECDVRELEGPRYALERIRDRLGPPDTLIYNAGAGAFANVDDASVDDFQSAWEVNARGLFLVTKAVLPDLRAAGGGNIVVVGATASLRAGAGFLPFASAKFAQRGLAQSLARKLGPENIHVSLVIIDGVIDLERTRRALPDKPDDFFLDPAAVAESVFYLTRQARQAWTFELDLRPYGERW
jgi:NAD(P)-dependent dehydrogenase (short-subunit alcohol dehydrogenase family)